MSRPRDWDAEIDRWIERFREVDDPPPAFAAALREGWSAEKRAALVGEATAEEARQQGLMAQYAAAGMDLVRLDCKAGSCGVCVKYCGKAYSRGGETPGLPPPPPLPICPSCRHTLSLLTPFYLQSVGLTLEDLVDDAQPFVD